MSCTIYRCKLFPMRILNNFLTFYSSRTLGRHGSKQSRNKDSASTTETIASSSSEVNEAAANATNTTPATITANNPLAMSCPFTSDITGDSKRKLELKEFDEKLRKANSSIDKALITRSGYHQSLLRVSWNLIESEIGHSPGKNIK